MLDAGLGRDAISNAHALIAPHIRKTPVIEIAGADFGLDATLVFKLELFQHAGSFKPRGAFTNLLSRPVPEAGVAAASGGNHGAAVAFAAARLGIPAKIFVPEVVSPAKLALIKQCGADVAVTGARYADALEACDGYIEETGALSIHAYDQHETLAGQGTVAKELEEQAPELDTVLVAVGGGGLIGGMATWYGGHTKIIAVEPERSCALHAALEAGRPTDVTVDGIAADSLGARSVGTLMLPIAQDFVDHVALVTDNAIKQAQDFLWEKLKIVAEPGGAAAFAALLSGTYRPRSSERVGVLVCGGNTTAVSF